MKRIFSAFFVLALAGCGTDVSGPSSSLLSCVFGDPAGTEVGEALQVQGAGHSTVCLEGEDQAEFVYIPFFGSRDTAAELSLGVTGAGVAAASTDRAWIEPILPSIGMAQGRRLVPDHRFHDRLRAREIEELGRRIRPGAPVAATRTMGQPALDVPTLGELRDFNVEIDCEDVDARTGEVVYVSEHAVVYADTANPADLQGSDYAYFGETFDTLVYRVETAYFGEPTDIDENGRAILFFTRAVNERNLPGSSSVTIGFFWSGDLFPEQDTPRLDACPESNHSEMFYLIAPDPDGVVGVPFSLDEVRDLAIPLIGHEFQHLINASRRLFVNTATAFEAPWLNEGLSHVAEELLYFDVAGLRAGQNLTIDSILQVVPNDSAAPLFNRYMGSNFNNFSKFLSRPDTASLMGSANDLVTRGAIWHFLRYAADRSAVGDTTFFFNVVNGTTGGLDHLNTVLGGRTLDWMRDWTVSVYADDEVGGIGPEFRVDSWNLRSLYEGSTLEEYPLRVETLRSGQTVGTDLIAGGTSYTRFGVTADGRAAIWVEADGGDPPSALRGSFLRIR